MQIPVIFSALACAIPHTSIVFHIRRRNERPFAWIAATVSISQRLLQLLPLIVMFGQRVVSYPVPYLDDLLAGALMRGQIVVLAMELENQLQGFILREDNRAFCLP